MIEVVKFQAADMEAIKDQPAQIYVREFLTEEHLQALALQEFSYTIKIRGRIVACTGVIQYWKDRGEAWTFIHEDCKKEFYAIHKIVKRFLDICPLKRIEATVDIGFIEGHRWVKNLGFVLEAPLMKAYLPNGGDSSLYSRVRG